MIRESAIYTLKPGTVGYAAIVIHPGMVFGPLVMKIVNWGKLSVSLYLIQVKSPLRG